MVLFVVILDRSLLLKSVMIPFVYAFEGRIHSAVVSGIDLINQSLTVEWFERGETKGKEVQLYSESFLFMNFVATVTCAENDFCCTANICNFL